MKYLIACDMIFVTLPKPPDIEKRFSHFPTVFFWSGLLGDALRAIKSIEAAHKKQFPESSRVEYTLQSISQLDDSVCAEDVTVLNVMDLAEKISEFDS